jgi:hypothetical protein
MAFSDPQSITISGTPYSLPRVSSGQYNGEYSSSDGLVDLLASHSFSKDRIRRVLRVNHSKIAADPFIPAQNREVSMSNYMVFDVPVVGYTNAEVKAVYTGFKTLYTATSDALIDKLLGGES